MAIYILILKKKDKLLTIGSIFESALYSLPEGLTKLILNLALKAGSSKQGNAHRAKVGSKYERTQELKDINK